jgi:hypothetical protein
MSKQKRGAEVSGRRSFFVTGKIIRARGLSRAPWLLHFSRCRPQSPRTLVLAPREGIHRPVTNGCNGIRQSAVVVERRTIAVQS